jgi:iron-sulfur cluster repair protein YtfE (RIC family)
MRHPSLLPLSHDHHHGLALALRCRKQALGQIKPMGAVGLKERAGEVLGFFRNNLVAHFRAEEEILFPFMCANMAGSEAMIDELVRQHEEIRHAADEIAAGGGLAKLIFDLGHLLERHIRKEERELFPLFEAQVDAAQADLIGARLKERLIPQGSD